jgi:hypothetical protein
MLIRNVITYIHTSLFDYYQQLPNGHNPFTQRFVLIYVCTSTHTKDDEYLIESLLDVFVYRKIGGREILNDNSQFNSS